MKWGPILLIDDDADDVDIIEQAINDIGYDNKLVWLKDCGEAWDYLQSTPEQPFIILCDMNLPKQSGLEFKKELDADPKLRRKSIPFVFYSTSVDRATVNRAYLEITVQGFFMKEDSYSSVKRSIKTILDYWVLSKHPNTM